MEDSSSVLEVFNDVVDDDEGIMSASIHTHMVKILLQLTEEIQFRDSKEGRLQNAVRNFSAGHLCIMLDYFWPRSLINNDETGLLGPVYSDERFESRLMKSKTMFNSFFNTALTESKVIRQRSQAELH